MILRIMTSCAQETDAETETRKPPSSLFDRPTCRCSTPVCSSGRIPEGQELSLFSCDTDTSHTPIITRARVPSSITRQRNDVIRNKSADSAQYARAHPILKASTFLLRLTNPHPHSKAILSNSNTFPPRAL